jgi:hypothetical protein
MAGRHLVAVANDVLDLAQVESGHLELRPQPMALVPLLAGCATMVQPAAAEKGVALVSEFDGALPAAVAADPTRLRQLVLNLLKVLGLVPARGKGMKAPADKCGRPEMLKDALWHKQFVAVGVSKRGWSS